MDFLTIPDRLRSQALVPDLGGPDFDNCGFLHYPQRRGWRIERLLSGDIVSSREEWNEYSQIVLRDTPSDQMPETGEDLIKAVIGPFIQTWLFFGLFSEVLNRPVIRAECSIIRKSEDNSETRYLSARCLFREFLQRKESIAKDVRWCTRVSACLRKAAWALNHLDEMSDVLGGHIVPGFVQLGLAVVVNTLNDHCVIMCQPLIHTANASVGRCRWFEQTLLDEGWCPNLVKRLRTDLGIEGLYCASLTNSPVSDRSHRACTSSVCVAYNHAKDETYLFQHSFQYCSCKELHCRHLDACCVCTEPDGMESAAAEAAAIVEKGRTPLLSLTKNGLSLRLHVTSFSEGIKYIAISHVWSDGMGNPHSNSLPLCQIQALDHFVGKALINLADGDPAYFWIDTICVPRTPDSLRWSAISRMRHVYRDADCVLVICKELSAINLPLTPDEILVRIFRSKWMTRLWTLQEGALATRLAFQFADHAVDYGYLDDLMIAALVGDQNFSHLLGNRANISLSSITRIVSSEPSARTQEKSRQHIYSSLWSALRHRATSRPSDEAICAAILLEVDLDRVLESPDERKMVAFWSSQDQVPSGVLWVNGPRMDIDSLRWAPQSLLDTRTWALSFPTKGSWATRTSEGLIVQGIEAFLFPEMPIPSSADAVLQFSDVGSKLVYNISMMENVGNAKWPELGKHVSNCALLWNEQPSEELFSAGTLVSWNKTNTGIRRARWLAQVSVSITGGEWDRIILEGPSEFHDGTIKARKRPVVEISSVDYIEADTQWCIW